MTRIIFIGSNPSNSSSTNRPFDNDTLSRRVLDSWIKRLDVELSIEYLNLSDLKTKDNKPLSAKDIRESAIRLKKSLDERNNYKLLPAPL
ncbi:MAG: hypothetical protein EB127_18015 [Alphaproteobacteria bacterium]|nr:hypothetical protein [Alphaproteobacteria bacterium]